MMTRLDAEDTREGTRVGRVPARAGNQRRVTSLAAWDASPATATPVRWSEVAPAVVPRQTVVSVEISDGATSDIGIAALTSFVEPGRGGPNGRLEECLSEWLDAPEWALPRQPSEAGNPYEPQHEPLRVAVELAALDALGRRTGLPVASFLGGVCRSAIPAYASLPSFGQPSAAVACATAAVESGFVAVKFHASGSVDADLETIERARRELDSSVRLMWDASCAYELHSAVVVGKALGRAGFLWFEAPLADDTTPALRRLAREVDVPLVPDGMAHRSPGDWARDLAEGVWGALRLDVTRAPTVPSALRLVRLAEALGFSCEIQSFGFPLSQYANLQLMLSTRACRFFEAPFPAADCEDGLFTAPRIDGGLVAAPTEPGLGYEEDLERMFTSCELLARLSV
jgi:L-alanine-DL-glutamate epimerase-like enolase superfamily enzyme